ARDALPCPQHACHHASLAGKELAPIEPSRQHRRRRFARLGVRTPAIVVETMLGAARPPQPNCVAGTQSHASVGPHGNGLPADAAAHERVAAEVLDVVDAAAHAALERELDVLGSHTELALDASD